MPQLGLNIDHVATVRQARYRDWKRGLPPEPSTLKIARLAERAGVDSITVHLREDRRHIQEADVRELAANLNVPLNMEMAATPSMTRLALKLKPDEVCLVPENRQEVTTEGGLDLLGTMDAVKTVTRKLNRAGITVSAFIDAETEQVDAAHRLGVQAVELHTGGYANATTERERHRELARHGRAAAHANQLGLQVNAGHGLHYTNVREYIEDVPHLHTLNIGHAIVAHAICVGMHEAVVEMMNLLREREYSPRFD